MGNASMNWFGIDFNKFVESNPIKNNPSVGISYRLRDSLPIYSGDETARAYDITSKEQLSPDLDFIYHLNDKLRRHSDGNLGNFYFKLKLATIPGYPSNNISNFLYTYFGATELLKGEDLNQKKARSLINNIGNETLFWSIKNGKKPSEIVFNYNFCNLQNENLGELSTNLKGNELDSFIKSLS